MEIEETIECLQGTGPADVIDLTYALAVEMLILAQELNPSVTNPATKEEALAACKAVVASGKALQVFLQNVQDQGGNPEKLMEQVGKRRSPFSTQVYATQEGYLNLHAFKLGLAGVHLGVGRNKTEDEVCPDAGMILHKVQGEKVAAGDLIMEVFGKDQESLEPALALIHQAIIYSASPITSQPLIYKEIH